MKTIFSKEYDGESLYDVGRDIHEAFDSAFNPLAKDIPQDENGFQEGEFIVTIQWSPYKDE